MTISTRSSLQLKKKEELTVAILIEDIQKAHEWSSYFRRVGVIPEVYQSLKDYWKGILSSTPELSLIDIRLMSEGSLLLKDHPLVHSEKMKLSFYCEDSSSPLLYSTYELPHLGMVFGKASFEGQLKSILRRFNEKKQWADRLARLGAIEGQTDQKLDRLVEISQELKEKEFYSSLLKSVIGRFEEQGDVSDLEGACARVFSSMNEIKEFTILELSQNGQKLLSGQYNYKKFRRVPSLWLGRTCSFGIEFFAQNMASQICLELMGGELMSLLIKGKHDNPDKILFVRVKDEDFLNRFDWESFERYLSGFATRLELKNYSRESSESQTMSPWELLGLVDQIQFGKTPGSKAQGIETDWKLIKINFKDLIEVVADKKGELRFYWERFYSDFFKRFEAQKKHDFKLTCFGVDNVVLLVGQESYEKVMSDLKNFSLRYPFWKFFEDVDVVLAKNLKPEISLIPFSTMALQRELTFQAKDSTSKDERSLSAKKEKRQAKIWGQAPDQSM